MAEESKGLLSTGKAKMFFGVTLLVGILVGYFAAGYIPPEGDVAGTIGGVKKAEKYRAEQISDKDVLLQDPELQNVLQSDEFQKLITKKDFQNLMANEAFANLMANEAFANLMANEAFANLMANKAFANLMANKEFANLIIQ